MARKLLDDHSVLIANTLYHDGRTVAAIARQLKCSWATADRLIIYSRPKWEERLLLGGSLPLHFDDLVGVAL